MKTIIIKILLVLSLFTFFNINFISNVYAAEGEINIIVMEKVPWAGCTWEDPWPYTCTVKKWFWSVVIMLWQMIKYFTFIAWLVWVLYLVINWIMYSMWWMDPWMKDKAKEWIKKTLIWLIILLLSWFILNIIAPWIYT